MKIVYVISMIVWGPGPQSIEYNYLKQNYKWSHSPYEALHFDTEENAEKYIPNLPRYGRTNDGIEGIYKIEKFYIKE